jgi:hypothetical protein
MEAHKITPAMRRRLPVTARLTLGPLIVVVARTIRRAVVHAAIVGSQVVRALLGIELFLYIRAAVLDGDLLRRRRVTDAVHIVFDGLLLFRMEKAIALKCAGVVVHVLNAPACATGNIIKVPKAPATSMNANRFMEFLLQFLQFRHAIDFGLIDAGRMPEKVRAPTDELIQPQLCDG